MLPERRDIPAWARQERERDFGWIQENLQVFEWASKTSYESSGRGALVVDTTIQPIPGRGHPFVYFSQEQFEDNDDEDTKRIVQEYDPEKEFVVVLIKADNRTSTYRVQPLAGGKRGSD
jgi:hypothetical protein